MPFKTKQTEFNIKRKIFYKVLRYDCGWLLLVYPPQNVTVVNKKFKYVQDLQCLIGVYYVLRLSPKVCLLKMLN